MVANGKHTAAAAPFGPNPTTKAFNDSTRRPGYQSGAPDAVHQINGNHIIWFKVRFSSKPKLQITHIVSYNTFGTAAAYLLPSTTIMGDSINMRDALAVFRLEGLIAERFTVPRTALFMHPDAVPQDNTRLDGLHLLPQSVAAGEYIVAIQMLPSKHNMFKLLGLASC